jgi:hypothetical protein
MVSLLQAKKSIENAFINRPDVIGIGLDEITQTIKIYIDCEDTCDIDSIPGTIGGYPVEVVPIGAFTPLSDDGYRTFRFRPAVGGISAGHVNVTTGTIGAVIRDKISGQKLFLSNNHVFANTASVTNGFASEGDPIIQPGSADGGNSSDAIATLYKWVPFQDTSMNLVDAALALPVNQDDASMYILSDHTLNTIPVQGVRPVTSAIRVKKYSRTSDMDLGVVVDWNFSVAVDYKDGITRNFTDQILVKIQTQGGDSGSLLLDENDNAVGLIFAGGQDDYGNYYGVANKIRNVLIMFGDGVDITDGWTIESIIDPKPVFEYEPGTIDPGDEEPSDGSLTAAPLPIFAIAGIALVSMAIVLDGSQPLNTSMYHKSLYREGD